MSTQAIAPARRRGGPLGKGRSRRGAVLLGVLAVVLAGAVASLLIGARLLDPATALHALLDPGSGSPEAVIMANRLRRTVIGLTVGAALAAAGGAMQGVTRNPLGDPGILGLNAGATLAVVVGITFAGAAGALQYAGWALAGTAGAAVLVYSIAGIGRGGPTPIKLALVGAAFAAGAVSVTSALRLQRQETLDALRHWQIGSLTRATYGDLLTVLPLLGVGLCLTVALASSINNFALGDDMARSLGEKVALKRFVIFLGITALCAGSVALAGPIAFLGLMAPHAMRSLLGPDYRWIMPTCLLAGPALLLWADVLGRVILPPTEVEVGVSMAVLGVPVFIALIRSRKAVNL